MKELFAKETKEVIDLAARVQEAILRDLDELYGKKLMAGYEYSGLDYLLNPHKERHQNKIKIALELKAACMKKLSSIVDVQRFIKFYEEVVGRNKDVDPEGHKFGQLLAKREADIFSMSASVRKTTSSTKDFYQFTHEILVHLHAEAIEAEANKGFTFQVGHDDHHTSGVERAIENLARLFKDRDDSNAPESEKNAKAKRKAEFVRDLIIKDIDACGTNKQAKIELLQKYSNLYIKNLFIHDIREDSIVLERFCKFIQHPEQLKRMLLFTLAAKELENELAIAEKEAFWQARVALHNSISASADGSGKDRMLDWLKECYRRTKGVRQLTEEERRILERQKEKNEDEELEREIRQIKREVRTGSSALFESRKSSRSISNFTLTNGAYIDFSDPLFNTQFSANLATTIAIMQPCFDGAALLNDLLAKFKMDYDKHVSSLTQKVVQAGKKLTIYNLYNDEFISAWKRRLDGIMKQFIERMALLHTAADMNAYDAEGQALWILADANILMAEVESYRTLRTSAFVTSADVERAKKTVINEFLHRPLSLHGMSIFANNATTTHVHAVTEASDKVDMTDHTQLPHSAP